MVVLNLTRKIKLTGNLKKADSLMDKHLGLLRSSNPRSLLFKTRFGVYTFGLKVSIDLIVLDNQFKVVKLGQEIKPGKLFFWNPKYCLVLELPEGIINSSGTKIGDLLEIS